VLRALLVTVMVHSLAGNNRSKSYSSIFHEFEIDSLVHTVS